MGHQRIEKGIRTHRSGLEGYVDVKGRRRSRYFRADTPLSVIRRWLNQTRIQLEWEQIDSGRSATTLPKSPDGWCYLYVVRCGGTVKIGRAADLKDRVRAFQTAQSEPIAFVAAAPIHATLEPLIHKKLEPWRTRGEWYECSGEVLTLIELLKRHINPVLFVWPDASREIREALSDPR